MPSEDRLFVGGFQDFHDPTVLFWGTTSSLEHFADWLRSLSRETATCIDLADLPWVSPFRATEIRVEIGAQSTGMERATPSQDGPVNWGLAPQDAGRFAELVRVVAGSDKPCHHYLDAEGGDELVVVVSKGEYDDLTDGANGTEG